MSQFSELCILFLWLIFSLCAKTASSKLLYLYTILLSGRIRPPFCSLSSKLCCLFHLYIITISSTFLWKLKVNHSVLIQASWLQLFETTTHYFFNLFKISFFLFFYKPLWNFLPVNEKHKSIILKWWTLMHLKVKFQTVSSSIIIHY